MERALGTPLAGSGSGGEPPRGCVTRDGARKRSGIHNNVMPAKAGIQEYFKTLDSVSSTE